MASSNDAAGLDLTRFNFALITTGFLFLILYGLLGEGCILYYHDNFAIVLLENADSFAGLPPLFLISFVWMIAELVRLPLLQTRLKGARVWAPAIVVGVCVYAMIVFGMWLREPVPSHFLDHEQDTGRLYASIYWPIGIAVDQGRSGSYTCGQ